LEQVQSGITLVRAVCAIMSKKVQLNCIAAACEDGGIGVNGDLPWKLKKEMAHFNRLTRRLGRPGQTVGAVVMGRRTWDSIPDRFRPLVGRVNYVLSRSSGLSAPGAVFCCSIDDVIKDFEAREDAGEELWAIGGSAVYEMAFHHPLLHRVYLTTIMKKFPCDTFLPKLPEGLTAVVDPDVSTEEQQEGDVAYRFQVLERTPA